MTWRNDLRTPSFRGIRFNITNSEREGGRDGATHTFIGRDVPYREDVARIPRSFSFDAFVSGFDYFRQRDRLIEALEAEGPGTLVHPYYGTMEVNVISFRLRESATEGSIARFSLEFVEAGKLVFPSTKTSKGTFLSELRAAIEESTTAEFLNAYSITRYPQFIIDEAQDRITELADLIDASTDFITGNADKISDLSASVADLRNDIDDLVNTPTLLAARMGTAISLLSDSVFSKRESFRSYQSMLTYGGDVETVSPVTKSREQQNDNNTAFINLVKAQSVFYAVFAAVDVAYTSETEANTTAQYLFSVIDELSETVEDEVFSDLSSLRAHVSLNIPPEDEDLPKIFDFELTDFLPALVVSYRLFGDTESETDLINRNGVEDPNFVPGGQTLRAVSRV